MPPTWSGDTSTAQALSPEPYWTSELVLRDGGRLRGRMDEALADPLQDNGPRLGARAIYQQGFVDFCFGEASPRSRKLTPSLYRRLHGLSVLAMIIRTANSTSFCAIRPVRSKPARAHRRLPFLLTSAGGVPAPLRWIFITCSPVSPVPDPWGDRAIASAHAVIFPGVYCLMRPETYRGRPPARWHTCAKQSQGRTK